MDHMNHGAMDATTTPMSHMDHAGHGMTTMDHSGHNMANHNMTGGEHNNHMNHDMHNMDMPGMIMYFHTGVKEYVLFQECLTGTVGELVAACFVVFFVAILYEGLKFLREVMLQRSLLSTRSVYMETKIPASGSSSHEQMVIETRNASVSSRMLSCSHFIQTILHVLQVFISYCLMLVFMTYNVYLCIAVVLGAGVGYFLFGWKRAVVVDANEHCH